MLSLETVSLFGWDSIGCAHILETSMHRTLLITAVLWGCNSSQSLAENSAADVFGPRSLSYSEAQPIMNASYSCNSEGWGFALNTIAPVRGAAAYLGDATHETLWTPLGAEHVYSRGERGTYIGTLPAGSAGKADRLAELNSHSTSVQCTGTYEGSWWVAVVVMPLHGDDESGQCIWFGPGAGPDDAMVPDCEHVLHTRDLQ